MARLCRARLTLPGADGQTQVIFTCNDERGHADGASHIGYDHVETGKARGLDGKVRAYCVRWTEVQATETWRQQTPNFGAAFDAANADND